MKRFLLILCLLAVHMSRKASGQSFDYGIDRAKVPLRPFQSGQSVHLLVKQIKQDGPRCAPTSASIVLEYYGMDVSAKSIWKLKQVDFSRRRKLDYEPHQSFEEIRDALNEVNFHWTLKEFPAGAAGFQLGLLAIKQELRWDHPVIAEVCLSGDAGHAFVIAGYDEFARLIYIVDSALPAPGKRVMTCEEFEKIWNRRDGGFMTRGAMFTRPQGEKEVPLPAGIETAGTTETDAVKESPTVREDPPSPKYIFAHKIWTRKFLIRLETD